MKINKPQIEKKALEVRQGCPAYGITDLFGFVLQRNIDLIRFPFGKDKLLGFSLTFEGRKVIVSNSSEILAREIYTVAHELGHILFDFEDETGNIKIDIELNESSEELSEQRAFYFANCLLMPEEQLRQYIRLELKKAPSELVALDMVRMQLEFQVSYAALAVRLHDLKMITAAQKNILFNARNTATSKTLFQMLDADSRLLTASKAIEVPPQYLEFVFANYGNRQIPYSSFKKALELIGLDASSFKEEEPEEKEPDLDDVFEEFQ